MGEWALSSSGTDSGEELIRRLVAMPPAEPRRGRGRPPGFVGSARVRDTVRGQAHAPDQHAQPVSAVALRPQARADIAPLSQPLMNLLRPVGTPQQQMLVRACLRDSITTEEPERDAIFKHTFGPGPGW